MWKFYLFCIAFIQNAFPMAFLDFKTEMEDLTLLLASKIEEFYSDWCSNGNASCETLTYNGCRGIRAKHCDTGFQTPSTCFTDGAFVSSASSISFPESMAGDSLSEADIRFICSSAKLEKTFQELNKIRNKRFSYMFAGSKQGLFRIFPGELLDSDGEYCHNDYDPRTRPWYTIAASGAKNVIILLDNSKSTVTKEEDIRFAALSMIDTLSFSDNVGVIAFSDSINVVSASESLIRVSSENNDIIKLAINKIKFSGTRPDLESAFLKGIEIANHSLINGLSGCSEPENIFLLISSGDSNFSSENSSDGLIKKIKEITENNFGLKKFTLFIYVTGSLQNPNYLKQLSCIFNGTLLTKTQTASTKKTSIPTDLQHFYKYLSVGGRIPKPIWSSPYEDYFTGIEYVSVTIPVYFTSTKTNLSTMFGVVGVDVPTNQFLNFEFSKESVINKLITESPCQKNVRDQCTLEKLRYKASQCGTLNCGIEEVNETSCLNYPKYEDIFISENINNKNEKCCGIKKVEFGLIVGGSVLFLILLILTILWKRNKIFTKCFIKDKREEIKWENRKKGYVKKNESESSKNKTIKFDDLSNSQIDSH